MKILCATDSTKTRSSCSPVVVKSVILSLRVFRYTHPSLVTRESLLSWYMAGAIINKNGRVQRMESFSVTT